MMQEHSLDEWAVLHKVKTQHWHLCHHCDRCDSSYYNIYIISIEALLYSNPLIHYTRNMSILSVTSVTPVTPLDLKWHVFFGWFFTIGQDVAYVGGGSLIELPETAVVRTILFETHVLKRFTDLYWRQAYLAAEAGDDVGGGEIDGLLVFAGLAVAGGDEFACKVWGLIGAVAGVELRSFLGE